MPGMRHMGISLDEVPKRDETDYSSSFQLEWRSRDGLFAVQCVIGQDKYTLGKFDEPTARRVLTFCSARPERARYAARQLHLHANDQPLEQLLSDAQNYTEQRTRRRAVKVTMELFVNMAGSDDDVKQYLHDKLQYAAHVIDHNVLTIEET